MTPEELVRRLDDLHETDRAAVRLIAEGPRVVPALVGFLLDGPRLLPQPRIAAAEALAAIGGEEAREGLIRALDLLDAPIDSPALRLSEEAVSNAAAACLARFASADVVPALRAAFRRHRLIGAAEALSRIGDEDCVPDFVEALEDDFYRTRLLDVLERYGTSALAAAAAVLTRPVSAFEGRLGERRRVACRRFLAEHGTTGEAPGD
jgi:HEAT repeat protein